MSKSEKVNQFVNTIAHDIKSMAISTQGFAMALKKKCWDDFDEKGKLYCDQIIKITEHIYLLAEDINIYISTRENTSEFKPVKLKELWNITREEFVLQFNERNIKLSEPHLEYAEITCNKNDILRVFRNLIDNALKYGGTCLTEIAMGYELSRDYHILTVMNNGEIIERQDEKIIFEEFVRKNKRPQVYGTGLGLAIVKQIAQKHKGTAWLSTRGDGNLVFCISISRNL